MTDEYTLMVERNNAAAAEFLANPKIMAAITKRLPNDEDETDLDAWGEGMNKFMRDNESVLKAWLDK